MTSRRLLDPISKCLLEAADYIEEHGHHKGGLFAGTRWFTENTPAACAIGAMVACGEVPLARNKLRTYLGFRDIAAWNDAPERTKEEVVTALREAAIHDDLTQEQRD